MGFHLAPARGNCNAVVLLSCLTWLLLSIPEHARAFCRESTTSATGGDCDVTSNSVFLFWDRDCMTYVFNRQVFSRITKGESFVRNTFSTSFKTWADVQCSSTPKTPFLVAQASGTTNTTAAEFLYDQPNESIIVVRTKDEWRSLPDHDSLALALTLIWHDKKTGEILDVDMELNGGAGTFSDCSVGCASGDIDLQNTVTHEAGHLLGLGHSTVKGATMQPSTTRSPETEKRSLETDDKMGYCACALPAGPCEGSSCTCPAPPVYSSHKSVSACNCHVLGRPSPPRAFAGSGLGILAGVWLIRRRRRQSRS